ncbi:MAG TPA: hypothetical protein VNP73_06560 [Actinomycetota bacterium]|nr:hypothetical protein [Actinomycetota bacterium]
MTSKAIRIVIAVAFLLLLGSITMAAPALAQREPYSNGNCCNDNDDDDDDDDDSPPITSEELPSFPTPANTPPPEVLGGQIPGAVPRPETQPDVQPGIVVPEAQQPGILPFTGADLLLYGMTGAAAIGTGMSLVRIGRRSKPDDE